MSFWRFAFFIIITFLILYLFIVYRQAQTAVKRGQKKLLHYPTQIADLSYGKMTYIDTGKSNGETLLSIHGLFGGYDQAYTNTANLQKQFRIIAPSRFGYPGSDIKEAGSPINQVEAFSELLNELGIDKTYVLGTSAGGTSAIRFALTYPERCKGLILYISAAPINEPTENFPAYQGPPEFLVNNFGMFLISPLYKPLFGMDAETIHTMMPINERAQGVILDAKITNPDMARNYKDYPIEDLQVRTLIFHAWDDTTASPQAMFDSLHRFPHVSSHFFDTGGHMMIGHEEEMKQIIKEFVQLTK